MDNGHPEKQIPQNGETQILRSPEDDDMRDFLHLDPSERASILFVILDEHIIRASGMSRTDALPQPYSWDMVCFTSQVLVSWAIMSDNEYALNIIRKLNNFIFSAHYEFPDDSPALGPDRQAHYKLYSASHPNTPEESDDV